MSSSSPPSERRLLGTDLTVVYLSFLVVEALWLVPTYFALRPAAGSIVNVVVGSVGLFCMIAMHVYSIARRNRRLRQVMRLSWWLHLHIFLGLQGILLSYLHCLPLLWRHGPPILVNPGMLNLYAITVVFASGVFGRYLFAQVPKTLGGQHLTAKALDEEIAALPQEMPPEVQALWAAGPRRKGFSGLVAEGFARRRALRELKQMPLEPDMKKLAARRVVLERQRAMYTTARRIFATWIVLHRPVAVAMYLITAVHVALGLLYTPTMELL